MHDEFIVKSRNKLVEHQNRTLKTIIDTNY